MGRPRQTHCKRGHSYAYFDERVGRNYCRECAKLKQEQYRLRIDPEKLRQQKYRSQYLRPKRIIVDAYGGACECCGEREFLFLTIDHVHEDGNVERKAGWSTAKLYKKIIAEGFPSRYRLLCYNCNNATYRYRVCPHQQVKAA